MERYRATVRRAMTIAGLGAIFGTSTVVAGTGVGAVMNLGETNTVDARTVLKGSVDLGLLNVENTNTGANAAGLGVIVPAGKPPIRVNATAGKATNLDADKIDGLDSAQLQRRVGTTCTAGSTIREVTASGAVTCELDDVDGGNAARLEGRPASDFVLGGGSSWGGRAYISPGQGFIVPGVAQVTFRCRGTESSTDTLSLTHYGDGRVLDYWYDNGSTNPRYGTLWREGETLALPAVKSGERITLWFGYGEYPDEASSVVTFVSINIGTNCLVHYTKQEHR